MVSNEVLRFDEAYTPDRDRPGVWISGRCTRPRCGQWFTVRQRYDVLASLTRSGSWPRWCSETCRVAVKTKRKAARVNLVKKPPAAPAALSKTSGAAVRARKKAAAEEHPHTSTVVGRTVWAGAYCRRPGCRAGFVTLLPVIDGELGQRPPFCSDACQRATNTALRGPLAAARRRADTLAAVGKLPALRQPDRTPTLPDHVIVAGWCARPVCGQSFNLVIPLWGANGAVYRPPRFCSITCWRRDRNAREDAHRAAVKAAAETRQAVATARRTCRACWARPRSGGYEICEMCFEVLRESCRRKRRRSEEAARKAAARRSVTEDRTMVAYPCGVCRYWHIGGETQDWRAKRVRFLASVFVASAPPGEVRRLIAAWNPHNMDLNQQLNHHEGLAALRDQLETELEQARW